MKVDNRQYIPKRIQELLADKQYEKALKKLEKFISDNGGLFANQHETFEMRRATWLLRIEILMNIGRLSEALAWVCLECEFNPNNITAAAMKKQLMKELNLVKPLSFSSGLNPAHALQYNKVWNDVAGMRSLKAKLESEIVLPLLERELYETYKVPVPNGVLFYGPPGCGKSFIAQKLAERLGLKAFSTKPSDFGSIYVHGSQEKINNYFAELEKAAPCALIIDELDALLPDRTANINHSYAAEVNEFLVHLDKASSKDILVIGTTNFIEKIDTAAIRSGRFDLKIEIPLPDYEARIEMIHLYLEDRPQDFIDWQIIAENTEGKSIADLKNLIDSVAKLAIKNKEKINMKHFYAKLDLA